MKIRHAFSFLMVLLMVISVFPSAGFAAHLFMEADEVSESGYPTISSVTINAKSALRVGDTGTGTDDDVVITAPYSEPRTSGHAGVDLRSRNATGTAGRDAFSVLGNGEVYQLRTTLGSTYGRYALVQHKVTSGGTDYYVQSFYAHLASVNVTSATSVTNTTNIGQTGGSGTTESSYPIHLHLEFRGASATDTNTMKRYAPSYFYQHKGGSYANKMSFITRTAASSSSVTFQIQSIYSGVLRTSPPSKVKLFYKNGNMTSWSSTSMTVASDDITFTGNLTPLYGTSDTLQYYVEAENNSYNGTTYYTGYRPYRYDNQAPTDRPFFVSTSLLAKGANSDIYTESMYATAVEPVKVDIPDTVNVLEFDFINSVELVRNVGENEWEVISNDDSYVINVLYPALAPELSVGKEYLVSGNFQDKNQTRLNVEGDFIRNIEH